jgi:hypothetical protein
MHLCQVTVAYILPFVFLGFYCWFSALLSGFEYSPWEYLSFFFKNPSSLSDFSDFDRRSHTSLFVFAVVADSNHCTHWGSDGISSHIVLEID